MRRVFETDAVIIAVLLLLVGTYKLTTSDNVQAGFVRLTERLTRDTQPVPTQDRADADSGSQPAATTRRDLGDVTQEAGIEVLPRRSSVVVTTAIAEQSEALQQAVLRGRQRLSEARCEYVEIPSTSRYAARRPPILTGCGLH